MVFPKVENGKIISVKSQKLTGIILNNDGSFYLNKGDNYFLVHDNMLEAITQAEHNLSLTNDIEILLFDYLGNFIKVIK